MTELTNVKTDAFSTVASGGVLLEPDGLTFLEPARLTIAGEHNENSFVMSAANDGTNLEFSETLSADKQRSINLYHFSSAFDFTVNDPTMVDLEKISKQQYEEAVQSAKALLKEPIEMPPPPPNIQLKCGGVNTRLGGVYYKRIMLPEEPVLLRLLSAGMAYEAISNEKNETFYYATELLKRNMKKTGKLIKTYKPDPDKFAAVAYAGLRVQREANLLSVDISYFSEFSDWAAKVADKLLDDLRKKHDYKAFYGVMEMVRFAKLSGYEERVVSIEEITEALRFMVDFDVSCYLSAGEQRMMLKGSVDVGIKIDEKGTVAFGLLSGEGKGEYVSYTNNTPVETTIDFPNEYPVNMQFTEFLSCEGAMNLLVDKIGADVEVWYNSAMDERFTSGEDADLFVNTLVDELLKDYRQNGDTIEGDGKGYIFPLRLYNMKAEMCKDTIVKTGSIQTDEGTYKASIAYNISVIHKPK